MNKDSAFQITVRGRLIREDADGFVCVTDIHSAAGYSKNQRPADFQRLPQWMAIATELHEKLVGKSHQFKTSLIWRSKTGPNGGTYAHPILALAFAEYLSPKLAVEVRETFLRAKQGDATLADEILQKSGSAANEWAAKRALARSARNDYTAMLAGHGVTVPTDFAACTNATYTTLFGKTAKQMKAAKGVPEKSSLRDAMTTKELIFTMASEALSSERIEEENSLGPGECRTATAKSARFIRDAIEGDRRDRRSSQPTMF
ncbi:KilA-N domain-containing protein [Mesorhizobium sp. M0768]|uniref:KilA-N domain-containing protein n=1 Tax=unclassified Mesorhizobium TaxID=325217 RepID=UPI00333735A9